MISFDRRDNAYRTAYLALPAIETQPSLLSLASAATLTWALYMSSVLPRSESNSLVVNLGVLVAISVVDEPDLHVLCLVGNSHSSGM